MPPAAAILRDASSLAEGLASGLRLGVFLTILIVMAGWEWLHPRRPLSAAKPARWLTHLLLTFLNSAALRICLPLTVLGAALWAEQRSWGLLHQISLPASVETVISFVLLDLAIYGQHVASHHVPLLWRIHLVHHADLDIDVTTGFRFHTVEILISAVFKVLVVVLLGAPAASVLLFEIVLNGAAMFNHSNINLPQPIDRMLRWMLVTPDMHRVHHSVLRHETDSNFGFNLPWWDYLFRTYRPQPELGHEGMTIGLPDLRNEQEVDRLPGVLMLPLRSLARRHHRPATDAGRPEHPPEP